MHSLKFDRKKTFVMSNSIISVENIFLQKKKVVLEGCVFNVKGLSTFNYRNIVPSNQRAHFLLQNISYHLVVVEKKNKLYILDENDVKLTF